MSKPGDIVLAALPQADGVIKLRPALLLRVMPSHGDVLVCGVSTQLQHAVNGFDDVVLAVDPDYPKTGLKAASLIRLGFLSVLPRNRLVGKLGAIPSDRHRELLRRLAAFIVNGEL